MPGCWPTVVWRSAGLIAGGHRPMIRAGYHRGACPRWPPDPQRFPRSALLDGPSPLAPLPRFSAALGGRAEVWIKREDLLPLAFGGNKLRNLEFLVGAALAEGADTLVTRGRRWSNHCRLTAAAGAKAGLAVHLVLSGPPVDPPGPGRSGSTRSLGATVHQLRQRRSRRARGARRAASRRSFAAPGGGRTSIGVGGSGAIGACGPGARRARAGRPGARRPAFGRRPDRRCRRRPAGPRPGCSSGCAGRLGDARRRASSSPARPAELRPAIAAMLARLGELGRRRRRPTAAIELDETPARRRLRPADRRGRRGDRAPGPDRGDPRRPDLHRQGAGRARRRRPRPARWTASGRVLARRRAARAVRAARLSGRGSASYSPADRHASRSFIRPAVWSTAPA